MINTFQERLKRRVEIDFTDVAVTLWLEDQIIAGIPAPRIQIFLQKQTGFVTMIAVQQVVDRYLPQTKQSFMVGDVLS